MDMYNSFGLAFCGVICVGGLREFERGWFTVLRVMGLGWSFLLQCYIFLLYFGQSIGSDEVIGGLNISEVVYHLLAPLRKQLSSFCLNKPLN